MGKTNRNGKDKRKKGEVVPKHVRMPELGNPQALSPEERHLRNLLVTSIGDVAMLCDADPNSREVLGRVAQEQSQVGERARAVQLFPAMEAELLCYLKSGSMDNVEELNKLLARFTKTDEGMALHQALNRCVCSVYPVVRERANQLRAALSIPNRMEEAKRLLTGENGPAAIIATARFAGRDPMNIVAIEKIATTELGELQRRADVVLLYPGVREYLIAQMEEARRDLGFALDLVLFLRGGESPERLAMRVAFNAACNNPDNRFARCLRGIMNNELRHEFFSRFYASGAECVAEWMKELGAEERKQLEFAMTLYMNDAAENAISAAAFKVFAALHPPKKEQPRVEVPPAPVAAAVNDEWAEATILNAY